MEFVAALFAVGILVLFCYLVLRLLATGVASLTGRRFLPYRHLAKRYRGRYESRGLSDPPTVSFGYNGSNVRVGLAPVVPGQSSHPRTRVVARFVQGLPFRLELAPIGRPIPLQAPKGTRKVELGDPTFDRAFIVQANDAAMARELLQAPVRRAIENLRRLAPPAGMLLSVNPERMLVQVDRNLGLQAEPLGLAVHEALVIHDHLRTSVAARISEGVVVGELDDASAEENGPPICKVCGEPIVARHVVCADCRAPHHPECWEFIGACSIYGCQGKRSVAV